MKIIIMPACNKMANTVTFSISLTSSKIVLLSTRALALVTGYGIWESETDPHHVSCLQLCKQKVGHIIKNCDGWEHMHVRRLNQLQKQQRCIMNNTSSVPRYKARLFLHGL
jgi:hypothetical protein